MTQLRLLIPFRVTLDTLAPRTDERLADSGRTFCSELEKVLSESRSFRRTEFRRFSVVHLSSQSGSLVHNGLVVLSVTAEMVGTLAELYGYYTFAQALFDAVRTTVRGPYEHERTGFVVETHEYVFISQRQFDEADIRIFFPDKFRYLYRENGIDGPFSSEFDPQSLNLRGNNLRPSPWGRLRPDVRPLIGSNRVLLLAIFVVVLGSGIFNVLDSRFFSQRIQEIRSPVEPAPPSVSVVFDWRWGTSQEED